MKETEKNKQIHYVKYSSTAGVIEAEGESNFAPNGKKKTRKNFKRRCSLNLVPNSVQNVFQMDKRVNDIPVRQRVCAEALRYGKIAQSVFAKREELEPTGWSAEQRQGWRAGVRGHRAQNARKVPATSNFSSKKH